VGSPRRRPGSDFEPLDIVDPDKRKEGVKRELIDKIKRAPQVVRRALPVATDEDRERRRTSPGTCAGVE